MKEKKKEAERKNNSSQKVKTLYFLMPMSQLFC